MVIQDKKESRGLDRHHRLLDYHQTLRQSFVIYPGVAGIRYACTRGYTALEMGGH